MSGAVNKVGLVYVPLEAWNRESGFRRLFIKAMALTSPNLIKLTNTLVQETS